MVTFVSGTKYKEIFEPVDRLRPDDKENLLLSLLQIIRHLNQTGVITIQRMCQTCTYYDYSAETGKHFASCLIRI